VHHATRQLIFVAASDAMRSASALEALDAAVEGAPVRAMFPAQRGELGRFHHVDAPDDALDAIAERLRALPFAEGAYVKPPTLLAVRAMPAPSDHVAREATPDFTARQGYLDAAPAGIDARYAWALPGGRGAGVHVVDVEGGWDFEHEDLRVNKGGVIGGTPFPERHWRDHGTAVLGVIAGDANAFGVTGACPEAKTSAVSHRGRGSAPAIYDAAEALGPGDVVLIEAHRPGPRFNYVPRPDQRGFIPVEWWPDDLAVIQAVTARGVIVVEAAGNGAEDLDDALYDRPAKGFPRSWVNPLRRAVDTGAILVGAGAPPPGTHGRAGYGPDRCKLDFSNYGASVDAQGWGREVTTTGYGDLQNETEHRAYTDGFSGTSSASPVVVGALGCVQGVLRARAQPPLTPARARALLREACSPQQSGPHGTVERAPIGGRPDVRKMLATLDRDAAVTPISTHDARGCAWLASDGSRGAVDLYAVRVRGTASGRVEVTALDGGDGFRTARARFVTPIACADATHLAWALGDADAQGEPDLHAIDLGAATACVLTRSDDYAVVHHRAAMSADEARSCGRRPCEGEAVYVLVARDGRLDRFEVRCEGTASGYVELRACDRGA
jgi:hypothetical protein